jgi:branched-chain amino acid aminotransferase
VVAIAINASAGPRSTSARSVSTPPALQRGAARVVAVDVAYGELAWSLREDPRVTVGPATVVIIPEYKQPAPEAKERGITLFTVHIRRTAPDMQDQKLNSHSKLNCILACIQAARAGADEALMLDPEGAVATCNSTHFFIVRKGELWTSDGLYCLGGITRANVLQIARASGVPAIEKRFSLTDVYVADEAFVTGTFAGLTPVHTVDGRVIGEPPGSGGRVGPMTRALSADYDRLARRESVRPV